MPLGLRVLVLARLKAQRVVEKVTFLKTASSDESKIGNYFLSAKVVGSGGFGVSGKRLYQKRVGASRYLNGKNNRGGRDKTLD